MSYYKRIKGILLYNLYKISGGMKFRLKTSTGRITRLLEYSTCKKIKNIIGGEIIIEN